MPLASPVDDVLGGQSPIDAPSPSGTSLEHLKHGTSLESGT
ncbi:hypothetical protein VD0002_g7867 [Verticillium dahliae]|uniref:Uncharacterized protein n=1 Tax=Verticillium dahliae TaxID=27337 RepID=A0A2J8BRI9_VERDA|nr:hypothetical protein BJF96_g9289 [Verticillium dahliae]PNH51397.1 hypothetical protein VD0003_g5835 [Verticillium dahliae]PNH59693.1 hypothetical protein VD0002_g7867 [Verticillium dahliae]PNH63622.1 hypothetical protein VD0001_g9089 [Verticillium dahliae]RBQ82522.1 hypothetical protein VDGD_21049 [Verticillium dahliae]